MLVNFDRNIQLGRLTAVLRLSHKIVAGTPA